MKRVSKKFVWILTVLVVSIWGTITYNIVESMSIEESSDAPVKSQPKSSSRNSIKMFQYTSDVRDPFLFKNHPPKDSLVKHVAAVPSVFLPPFKLTGILTAGKKHTAMVEGPDGSVFFLQEKDTISGMTILKIKAQAVTYSFQKKTNDWILERP